VEAAGEDAALALPVLPPFLPLAAVPVGVADALAALPEDEPDPDPAAAPVAQAERPTVMGANV